ncbi:MAG TPA: hypothetical protein VMT68_12820 [Caulobacteraceae bacterium]|nr:hypothetical protein [Caulobacteraceae bacterium]
MILRLALAAALLASPALAQPVDNTGIAAGGWSFAHWGMTRAEVEAASDGKTHAGDDDVSDTVDGDYMLGGFKFQVQLAFDDATHLAEVKLTPAFPPKQCGALKAFLRDKLGAPTLEADTGGKTTWWRDERNSNAVEFSQQSGQVCSLAYHPLSTLAIVSS